jgi:hypothetical protein
VRVSFLGSGWDGGVGADFWEFMGEYGGAELGLSVPGNAEPSLDVLKEIHLHCQNLRP